MKKIYLFLTITAFAGLLFTACQDGTTTSNGENDTHAQTVSDISDVYSLPDLPYEYNSLEPHIDARTMEIHHSRHHQGYINNFNKAISGTPLENMDIEDILGSVSQHSVAVRNNGGGHYNHELYWSILSPDGGGSPSGELAEAINSAFESFQNFKDQLQTAGTTQFGSGWAWLIVNQNGDLQVTQTPNQDNPLMDVSTVRGTPILGVDVWEHAYYLHYQNKRGDYLKAFWNVVNWDEVAARYSAAKR
nr:superoxide dismutase [Saprospiraceae bacterium]